MWVFPPLLVNKQSFYCIISNAGGGGEKVLFSAIKAVENIKLDLEAKLRRKIYIVIYTGDNDVNKEDILSKTKVELFKDLIYSF